MSQRHRGKRETREISLSLWAGIGFVRGNDIATDENPDIAAARILKYCEPGKDTFIDLWIVPHQKTQNQPKSVLEKLVIPLRKGFTENKFPQQQQLAPTNAL